MNRVISVARQHITVAVVFLCMLALILCQVLGPAARPNHDFNPSGHAGVAFIAMSERSASAQYPLPSRCTTIKLAPFEIRTKDLGPAEDHGACFPTAMSTPRCSAELGVPTPPPRKA